MCRFTRPFHQWVYTADDNARGCQRCLRVQRRRRNGRWKWGTR